MRLLALIALLASPALADVDGAAILAARPPKLLSAFGFFDANGQPAPGVVPFVPASALFSDHAEKDRYVFTPVPASYAAEGVLQFPVGAALIKTFRYGDHRVETRVLLHQDKGWVAWPYVWNAEGTEAELKLAGADLTVATEYGEIAYHVPNANQCKACHIGADKAFTPIGPKVRNLNHGDQLAVLVAAGVMEPAPADAPAMPDYRDDSIDIAARARAYLDINCAHCHTPGHPADTSGLFLNWEETDPLRLGVMKRPVAAGRASADLEFDVVPGDPEGSILLHRLMSTDPGVMMPELGRSLPHEEGIALIRDWIAQLED